MLLMGPPGAGCAPRLETGAHPPSVLSSSGARSVRRVRAALSANTSLQLTVCDDDRHALPALPDALCSPAALSSHQPACQPASPLRSLRACPAPPHVYIVAASRLDEASVLGPLRKQPSITTSTTPTITSSTEAGASSPRLHRRPLAPRRSAPRVAAPPHQLRP